VTGGPIKFDLARFAAAVRDYAPRWERAAIRWQFTFGPGFDKSAAWVTCETHDRAVQLIIWTSGEAELVSGSVATDMDNVHYDLVAPADLGTCLDDLTQRIIERS